MTLREHVEAIIQALPPESSISLPVATLQQWLTDDGDQGVAASTPPGVHLTVERVAEVLGVGASRARDVIRQNQKQMGAHRRGRRWYVPPEGLAAWQRAQAQEYRQDREKADSAEVDFHALRDELRREPQEKS